MDSGASAGRHEITAGGSCNLDNGFTNLSGTTRRYNSVDFNRAWLMYPESTGSFCRRSLPSRTQVRRIPCVLWSEGPHDKPSKLELPMRGLPGPRSLRIRHPERTQGSFPPGVISTNSGLFAEVDATCRTESDLTTRARISQVADCLTKDKQFGHACGKISRMCATNGEGIVNFAALQMLTGNRAKSEAGQLQFARRCWESPALRTLLN